MFFFVLVTAALPLYIWCTARHTAKERYGAKMAYAEARGRLIGRGVRYTDSDLLSEACHVYEEQHGWSSSKKALREFMVRWQKEHPGWDVEDAHRPGPPPHMTDAECEQCIRELRAGYVTRRGRFRLFKSLDEAARYWPTVAMCRARYSHTDESGMWKRLIAYDKDLIRIKTRVVNEMQPKVLEQRVSSSLFFLGKGMQYAKNEFFIDEKTILMHPRAGHAIGYKKDGLGFVIETDPIDYYDKISHKRDMIKVKFYSMVNYYGGVCGFYVSQATTFQEKKYKACTSNPHSQSSWALHPLLNMPAMQLQGQPPSSQLCGPHVGVGR